MELDIFLEILILWALLFLTVIASPKQNDLATSMDGLRDSTTGMLRGVNIGGWLVLERWMTPDLFKGIDGDDQWSFDQSRGAEATLRKHWDTFLTLNDLQNLTHYGINAIRIPIGYWAYDNSSTPYLSGADAYLERAIGWARTCHMKVLIDLHGVPGSQNGYDNSGRAGAVNWQTPDNLARTTIILTTIAAKYGTMQYADVVAGIELVNEPIYWDNNNVNVTKGWAQTAYIAVQNAAQNKRLKIVMSDSFKGPADMIPMGKLFNGESTLDSATFVVDTHLYQLYNDYDQSLKQSEHIAKACTQWKSALNYATYTGRLPIYVGEWSAATDICVDSKGLTYPGKKCAVPKCQCVSVVTPNSWSSQTIEQVRRYVEAQLDTFEENSIGYFIWSYKAPGAWGFKTGIELGFFPNPITSRKYPAPCGIR